MSSKSEDLKKSVREIENWFRVALIVTLGLAAVSTGLVIGIYQSENSESGSLQQGLQQSVSVTKASYSNFLQLILEKLANVSHSKALKIGNPTLDAVASAFRFAGSSSDLTQQYSRLCGNQTSVSNFYQAANSIHNSNITMYYTTACQSYLALFRDYGGVVDSNTMGDLSSNFTNLALSLVRLDNSIQMDP